MSRWTSAASRCLCLLSVFVPTTLSSAQSQEIVNDLGIPVPTLPFFKELPPAPTPQTTIQNQVLSLAFSWDPTEDAGEQLKMEATNKFPPVSSIDDVFVQIPDNVGTLFGSGGGQGAPPHSFLHRGDMWKFELRKFPTVGQPWETYVCAVRESNCLNNPPRYASKRDETGTYFYLQWRDCVIDPTDCSWKTPPQNPPAPGESIVVILEFWMPPDGSNCVMTLFGRSNPNPAPGLSGLMNHSIESGRLRMQIKPDPVNKVNAEHHYLLTPWGYVTEDPRLHLSTVDDEYANKCADDYVDALIRPMTQLSAFYDDNGYGVYFATQDGTGERTKSFRYGASEDRSELVFEAISYAEDITSSGTNDDFVSLPLFQMGVFKGDGTFEGNWRTAAHRYSKFVDEYFGTGGLLAEREDVSDLVKNLQQVVVLGAGTGSYAPLECSTSLPDQLRTYSDVYGIDIMSTLQFGLGWVVGGEGGKGAYEIEPLWLDNMLLMEQEGMQLGMYLLDNEYAYQHPSYLAEGWDEHTIQTYWINVNNGMYVVPPPAPGVTPTTAKIDPYSDKWKERVRDLVTELASYGVDGIYVDNWFPTKTETNVNAAPSGYESDWHSPGYGRHLFESFNETFELIVEAGRAANPDFDTVYSEVNAEGTIPYTGMMGPPQPNQDFITGDENTRFVPLHPLLYHHLAGLGPVTVNSYMLLPELFAGFPICETGGAFSSLLSDSPLGTGKLTNSMFSTDEDDRERGKRAACYILAFAYVNGAPIWSPELSWINSPACGALSFQFTPSRYVEMVDFAARCSDLRGTGVVSKFLNTGRMAPPVEILSEVPEDMVYLGTCYPVPHSAPPSFDCSGWMAITGQPDCPQCVANPNCQAQPYGDCCYPQCPDHDDPSIDKEVVPRLLQSAWVDPITTEVGLAFVNHSAHDLAEVRFDFVPEDYGLNPAQTHFVHRVEPQTGSYQGSAYVYERDDAGTPADPSDDTWAETAKLIASDAGAGDQFGHALASTPDRILVSAPFDDDSGDNAGAVYVFDRDDHGTPLDLTDDTWTEMAKLTASDGSDFDEFGRALALSDAGDLAVIGAPGADGGAADAGAAYVFELSGSTWTQRDVLTASANGASDRFGFSVAISADTVLVGAPFHDGVNDDEGLAFTFERDDAGTPGNPADDFWAETDVLSSGDTDVERFGYAVAIDADDLIVGADRDDCAECYVTNPYLGTVPDAGSVTFFARQDANTSSKLDDTWLETKKEIAEILDDPVVPGAKQNLTGNRLGKAVALDGHSAFAAALADVSGGYEGSLYFLGKDPTTSTWDALDLDDTRPGLNPLTCEANPNVSKFAEALDLWGDYAVAGLHRDGDVANGAGAGFVLWRDDMGTPGDPNDDTWAELDKLTAADGAPHDQLARAVAVGGTTVVLGAPHDDHAAEPEVLAKFRGQTSVTLEVPGGLPAESRCFLHVVPQPMIDQVDGADLEKEMELLTSSSGKMTPN